MRWTGFMVTLLVTAVTSSPPYDRIDEWASPLVFPDGTQPDLVSKDTEVHEFGTRSTGSNVHAHTIQGSKTIDDPWRLDRNLIPSTYILNLNVDIDNFVFDGSEKITFYVNNATDKITLHTDALNLTASTAYVSTSISEFRFANVTSIAEDKEHLTSTLQLDRELEAEKQYELYLEFRGEIRKDLHGFYRASYKVGNETRWLATTQFEPTHARRAFPCFDEPNLKARFSITITHDKKYRAISNMPIENTQTNDARVTDTFALTPFMPTYLIAFIVSDFQNYTGDTALSNVWASEELIKDAPYSQNIGLKTLQTMEKYTGIKFALPKMDHAGLPNFAAGAMENWGLITYRNDALIKTDQTTTPSKQGITAVIAHEMAHQWFGDLVTLDWWSSTWLNEGFASFFENYVSEEITEGKWALWDQFIISKFQSAMDTDGNPETSVPMTNSVSSPAQIATTFGQITYGKGASVLRMFSEVLKPENFQRGLQRYLKLRQYRNAVPDDLFDQLTIVAAEANSLPKEIDFTHFAKSWTEQDGFPVVTVKRNYQDGSIDIDQKRFYDTKPKNISDYDRGWDIPLSWRLQNNVEDRPDDFTVKNWLLGQQRNESLKLQAGVEAVNDWFLLNVRAVGYFRVNYDIKNWQLLSDGLLAAPQNFSVPNRAQLINDAYAVASAEQLDFATAFSTLRFLKNERDTSVWMSASKVITKLLDKLGPTEGYPLFEKFGRYILNDTYYSVGLSVDPNEEHLKSLLRYTITPYACSFGVDKCMDDAVYLLGHHMGNASIIHNDVVTATVCGGVRAANEEAFWRIRKRIMTVGRSDVQQFIVSGLACTTNVSLVQGHLTDAITPDSPFPKELVPAAIRAVLTAPTKFTAGFEFMKNNFDKIIEKINKKETRILLSDLIRKVRTTSDYKQVNDWVNSQLDKFDDKDKIQEELKAAESYTKWNTLNLKIVIDWLEAFFGKNPSTTLFGVGH